jgi:hypothetical protein
MERVSYLWQMLEGSIPSTSRNDAGKKRWKKTCEGSQKRAEGKTSEGSQKKTEFKASESSQKKAEDWLKR